MPRFLLLARTAAVSLLAVFGLRAVLNTHVVWLNTNAARHVSPGRVTVSLAGGVADDDGVTLGAPALAPGDTAATAIDLVLNTSSGPSTLTLTTMAASSSLLDQDPVNGLQLTIARCSVPWEAAPGATRPRYRCPGRSVSVLAPRPVLVSNLPLTSADAGDHADKQHLLLSLTLPEGAGNEFQGLSSSIRYVFAPLESRDTARGS